MTRFTVKKKKQKVKNLTEYEILNYIDQDIIIDHAGQNLDMYEAGDCGCSNDIENFDDNDLIESAHERGLILYKPVSIVDAIRVEEYLRNLN